MEVRVAAEGEIPEGGVKIIQAGSLFVGIYLIDGRYIDAMVMGVDLDRVEA